MKNKYNISISVEDVVLANERVMGIAPKKELSAEDAALFEDIVRTCPLVLDRERLSEMYRKSMMQYV